MWSLMTEKNWQRSSNILVDLEELYDKKIYEQSPKVWAPKQIMQGVLTRCLSESHWANHDNKIYRKSNRQQKTWRNSTVFD
jgi:hypothetical protein